LYSPAAYSRSSAPASEFPRVENAVQEPLVAGPPVAGHDCSEWPSARPLSPSSALSRYSAFSPESTRSGARQAGTSTDSSGSTARARPFILAWLAVVGAAAFWCRCLMVAGGGRKILPAGRPGSHCASGCDFHCAPRCPTSCSPLRLHCFRRHSPWSGLALTHRLRPSHGSLPHPDAPPLPGLELTRCPCGQSLFASEAGFAAPDAGRRLAQHPSSLDVDQQVSPRPPSPRFPSLILWNPPV